MKQITYIVSSIYINIYRMNELGLQENRTYRDFESNFKTNMFMFKQSMY